MVYDLPLEEVKVKPHQITTLHLVCALAFIVAGLIIAVYNYVIGTWGGVLLAAGILLAAVTMVKNKWVTSNKVRPVLRVIELLISAAICILSFVKQWKFPEVIFSVLSLTIAFALYWERAADAALKIHIDDNGISLPVTARKRFISWPEVELVVLRFGTLSINCADNRLFQFNVPAYDKDNEILEAYCAAKVEDNRGKRIVDEW